MEKEQKKLLLVAVSVGVFLLVTVTAAFILLTPKMQTQEASFYAAAPVQPAGYVQPNNNITFLPSDINNIHDPVENTDITETTEIKTDAGTGNSLQIQIQIPNAAAVPNITDIPPAAVTIAPAEPRQSAAAESARTAAVTQPAPAKPSTVSAAAAQPSKTASALSRTINDYWIQTGAFTAKVRADDAKELLETKGLASIIENREIDGRTFYRVRLGPYTSENEANYWLALVKTINGFSDSQVRQTTRQL